MFEKEIKFIADFSLNKVKNLGSFFTFEKLETTDLHPAIIQYISAELDYLIYEDRRKLLQQSVFDYSGPEISKLFNQVNIHIKKTKRISYEDIKKLVIQAVSFNINFLARPKWSLIKIIYDNSDNKPVDEIKLMFNYFYYYDYLRNIFLAYLTKRKIVNLSLVDFELIINKIDKEIFSPSQSKKMLDNTLYSMADFFNEGGMNKSKLPVSPLEIFLREKNLMDYLFRLRRALPPAAKYSYEVDELRNVMYSLTLAEKQQVLAPKEEPDEPEPVEDYKPLQSEEVVISELAEMRDELITELEEEIKTQDAKPEIVELDEVPDESELNDDEFIIEGTEPDEDLLKMYDEELKEFESAEDLKTDKDEVKFDLSQKDHLDDMYEFEEGEIELNEDISLESALEEELQNSDEYNIADSDELIIEAEDETVKKLEIPDNVDEETEAAEDAEKKLKHEMRIDEFDEAKDQVKDDEDFISVPEEKKPVEKKNLAKDLFTYLSNKEIDKITANVFNEDRDDFANTMERITECSSYDEATEILKGVFFSYRVSPYSRDAVSLTNAVSNYFNQV